MFNIKQDAEELAESLINGNCSYVIEIIGGVKPTLAAAALTARIIAILGDDSGDFVAALARRFGQ